MRIWDIPVNLLCDKHLLGEHRELHAIWTYITTKDKGGSYRNHPETKRWYRRHYALWIRHLFQVREMHRRGFIHKSNLPHLPSYDGEQDQLVNTINEQKQLLISKGCKCATHLIMT